MGTRTHRESKFSARHHLAFWVRGVMQANETLELVRRQSIIAGFYKTDKSVMETLNDAVKQETRAGSAPSAR
jgi:hypothetical protein